MEGPLTLAIDNVFVCSHKLIVDKIHPMFPLLFYSYMIAYLAALSLHRFVDQFTAFLPYTADGQGERARFDV